MNKIAFFLLCVTLVSCGIKKEIVTVNHSNLPKPIGPYNHSTRYGNLIFVSGQLGLDPKTNSLKSAIEEQMVQIFENLKAILENNHSDFNHITKTTIFITDMKQFEIVNKIYGRYFDKHFPARSTIEVTSLPRNAAVEIECIAVKRN
ncbi:2-iminobutanoate/2-iminopropanoate deaminase [Pedobacter suwonensis]|uniref:2-iminobutanoate/2-iminopropanoate deaminase n=1 Tax=Pedobacter suwonensis TaxID=332999 RepID=A0A1I0U775_9SPHI|nr:RidA family protein [Pedobacter suwonensis]SFA59901.1 2-iminobutanoate/2-iminopropanoate deaminase [Pedobacter suwonensis]